MHAAKHAFIAAWKLHVICITFTYSQMHIPQHHAWPSLPPTNEKWKQLICSNMPITSYTEFHDCIIIAPWTIYHFPTMEHLSQMNVYTYRFLY